jgi:hypothetical protein
MAPHEISQKSEPISIDSRSQERKPKDPDISYSEELPVAAGEKYLHIVARNQDPPAYNGGNEEDSRSISGYDGNLMRDRVILSSEEEKKLIRRIDWHLIPLLSVIYMIKTVDFTNVCFPTNQVGSGLA